MKQCKTRDIQIGCLLKESVTVSYLFEFFGEYRIALSKKCLKTLNNVKTVNVLTYHNYAGSKCSALNIQNILSAILSTDEKKTKRIYCDTTKTQ